MIRDPLRGSPASEKLSAELFQLVESDQGKAFISDGVGVLSPSEIVDLARGSLFHSRRVCRKLEKFIKKHQAGVTEGKEKP